MDRNKQQLFSVNILIDPENYPAAIKGQPFDPDEVIAIESESFSDDPVLWLEAVLTAKDTVAFVISGEQIVIPSKGDSNA